MKFEKGMVCGGCHTKHKLPSHTPEIWLQKLDKAQRMWHPLCFHVAFETKKKNERKKMVCGGNVTTQKTQTLPTHHKTSMKKYERKKWNENENEKGVHIVTFTHTLLKNTHLAQMVEPMHCAWRCRFEPCSE